MISKEKSLGGRPKSKDPLRNRCLRMTDSDWASFQRLLGIQWLRDQIAKAEKKAEKQPIQTKE